MDYTADDQRWSPCSSEDFQKYYDHVTTENGGCFCLQAKSGEICEPKVEQPPTVCANFRRGCQKSQCKLRGITYQQTCMDTCGFCHLGLNTCLDKYSNCKELVSRDPEICKFGTTEYARDVRLYCRKSCNLCKKTSQKPFKKVECRDIKKNCDASKCTKLNYKRKCMATCGFCRYGPGTCEDRWSICPTVATPERCGYDRREYARKVRLYCRKSCTNKCKKVESKPFMPVECKDIEKNCQKTECRGFAYKEKCMETCGQCTDGKGTCKDKYSNCSELADSKTCRFEWSEWGSTMRVMCRKSCKLCA